MVRFVALNLARRPARTVLTALGIAVGVATIVALLSVTAGLNRSAASLIHLGHADLGLFQRGASDPTTSILPTSLAQRVARRPEVRHATPLLLTESGADPASSATRVGRQLNALLGWL